MKLKYHFSKKIVIHQSMIADHLHSNSIQLPLEVVNENIQEFLLQKCPEETATIKVEFQGTSYGIVMVVDIWFHWWVVWPCCEILQTIIVSDSFVFVVKLQAFRYFKLEPTNIAIVVIEQSQLTDTYPLTTYERWWNGFSETPHLLVKVLL